MLPENSLSTNPVEDVLTLPLRTSELEDFCIDPLTGGMTRVYYNGKAILLQKGSLTVTLLTAAGVTSLGYAIDKNNFPVLAYTRYGMTSVQYRDYTTMAVKTLNLGASVKHPRLSREKLREKGVSSNDVILAYIKESNLCTRAHSQTFNAETILRSSENLWQVTLMQNRRLAFLTY